MAGQAHDGLSVRMTSKDVYRVGDELRLSLQATEDCACLLFVRDTDGRYDLASDRSRYLGLRKGEVTLFPEEGERLKVTEPAGTDELLLICAPRPVPLESISPADAAGAAVTVHSYRIVPRDQ